MSVLLQIDLMLAILELILAELLLLGLKAEEPDEFEQPVEEVLDLDVVEQVENWWGH